MATAYRRPASHFPGIFLFVLLFLAIFLGFLAWRTGPAWPAGARIPRPSHDLSPPAANSPPKNK